MEMPQIIDQKILGVSAVIAICNWILTRVKIKGMVDFSEESDIRKGRALRLQCGS
jgi:hypothetical protein